ncbi:endonuclease domain-containing protein [Sphingosinithalassobacter sp. LHW66-3]|uniref:endonuclease domain-containing protein n=1 Tax=Sphingosinithalassobacter sp. LHW66-3 TaxID=3424718 RepID=UPI003D6B70BD
MRSRYTPGDGTIARARQLRRDATSAERYLWAGLRNGQLAGSKFRRQQRLGPYYADFVCHSARLVIELDGDTHGHTEAQDARRTEFLEREGYRVLRFANSEVMQNREGVLTQILLQLRDLPSPSHSPLASGPLPLPRGERGR